MEIIHEIATGQFDSVIEVINIGSRIVSFLVTFLVPLIIKCFRGSKKIFDIFGITKVKSYSDIAIKQYSMMSFIWIIHAVAMMFLSYYDITKHVIVLFLGLYFVLAGCWTYKNIKIHENIIDYSPNPDEGKGLFWGVYVLWGVILIIEFFRDFNVLDLWGISIAMVIWAVLVIIRPENIVYKCNHKFFYLYDKSTKEKIKICAQSIRKEGEWIIGRENNMQGSIVYMKRDNITQIVAEGRGIAWCSSKN